MSGNRQIIIGRSVAEALKKGPGDILDLGGSRFRVMGIYESGISWEDMGCVMSLRDAQTFTGRPRKVTLYAVKLHDPRQAEMVAEKINALDPGLYAALSGEFVDQLPDMEAGNGMISGISLLTIVVGGLGVMNTMLMAVVERTREIGVLRALGWRRRAVLQLVMKEALLLGLLGGVSGILVAFLLTGVLSLSPMVGGALDPRWDISVFLRAILVSLALGLVGGLYPAYRATKLQPVEALRYE